MRDMFLPIAATAAALVGAGMAASRSARRRAHRESGQPTSQRRKAHTSHLEDLGTSGKALGILLLCSDLLLQYTDPKGGWEQFHKKEKKYEH